MRQQQYSSISDYDITRTLGEGTFGKVRLGMHKTVRQEVALKILYKNRINEPAEVERISREIAILKALQHPHVVRLYEMIETREEIFLVMELAERGDLMQFVRSRDKLEEPQAAILFLQIVEAIEYIHSVGVAHRDVKPTNILLTKNLEVKLADFGLSNTYKPGTKLASSCGSPCYAAPEIIEAKLYDPLAADTWSLGIVLFFMVSGFLPFQHKNTHTLYKLILRGKCEIPSSVSKLAGDLICSLLRVVPTRRLRPSQIKSHPWIRLHTGRQEITSQIRQRQQTQQTLNDDVVKLLLRMGFDTEHLPQLLQKRRSTKAVTIYHFLCQKSKEELAELSKQYAPKERQSRFNKLQIDTTHQDNNPQSNKHSCRRMLKRSPRHNSVRAKSSTKSNPSFTLKGGYLKMLNTTLTSNGDQLLNTSITTKAPSISISTTYQPSLSRTPSQSIYSQANNPNNTTMTTHHNNTTLHSESEEGWDRRRTIMDKRSIDHLNNISTSTERKSSMERQNKLKRKTFVKHDPQEEEAPDLYEGPHMLEALFSQSPQDIRTKVLTYLSLNRLGCREASSWAMQVDLPIESEGEKPYLTITVLRVPMGATFLKFTQSHPSANTAYSQSLADQMLQTLQA